MGFFDNFMWHTDGDESDEPTATPPDEDEEPIVTPLDESEKSDSGPDGVFEFEVETQRVWSQPMVAVNFEFALSSVEERSVRLPGRPVEGDVIEFEVAGFSIFEVTEVRMSPGGEAIAARLTPRR